MGLLRLLFGGGDDDCGGDNPGGLGFDFETVVITCVNGCEHYTRRVAGRDAQTRFAKVREYLAGQGWTFEPGRDICPNCSGYADDYGVGEVQIVCDHGCGTSFRGDFVGRDTEDRFAAARTYLSSQG